MINPDTVRRLVNDKKVILPDKKVDVPRDERWNEKLMSSKILQGIMNGDSVRTMSSAMQQVIGNNSSSAIRNTRTMVTSAENHGRLDSYKNLTDQGVVLKKEWEATPDDRTRKSHIDIDGEEQDIDKPFTNGCQFPGDGNGPAEEVWCCRCSMGTHIIGFRRADGSISYVQGERDRTLHDEQIEAERERRTTSTSATSQINLSNLELPDNILDATKEYSERMNISDIEKFNEIFDSATYVRSENGNYYDPTDNVVYLSEESEKTTAFHESTHWFDYNQNYTITEDWGRYARDENGHRTDDWIPNINVIKENASFSEYISHEWGYYERGADSNLQMLDMKNFVEKVGTSDTYGLGRNMELVQQDMRAINAYLESMGVSRADPDYVHLSDFISAISYDANLGSLATGGHSYDYWIRGDERRVTEITAGYNLLKATGREDLIAVERDLAPNLMQLIETEWAKIWK